MADVLAKKNLGQLFGGKIVSIDYNFQPSSQASTATIVVVNENQNYQIPEFDTTINLPPFGLAMDVVEVTQVKHNYKYLQVELVEHTHQILDKELIILYGEHSTHKSELNEDLYWTFRSYFVAEKYWQTHRHPDMDLPVYPRIQRSQNGINLMGFARATINDVDVTPITRDYNFEPDAGYLKFDKGIWQKDISTKPPVNWRFCDPSQVSVEYGYYLTDLRDLTIQLGMSFKDDSAKYLEDNNVLFSDTGTLRDVLTSVLSKIGMTWYVDPMTQQIKILTNADVAQINANISAKHGDFNEPCASQIQFSQSIKGIEATHVVLKGDLNQRDQEAGGENDSEPRLRTDKLYRLNDTYLTKLSEEELSYINKFLPLLLLGISPKIISYYIYGTMIYEGSDAANWGELYGEGNDVLTGFHRDFEVGSSTLFRPEGQNNPRIKNFWDDAIDAGSSTGLFDIKNDGITAVEITSLHTPRGGVSTRGIVIDPLDDYIPYMEDFVKLFGGIYISDAMNQKEAEARVYNSVTKRGQQVQIFAAPADAFISEIPELDFLVRILRRAKHRTNITIKELADDTNVRKDPAVNNVIRAADDVGDNLDIDDNPVGFNPVVSGANTNILGSNYHMIAVQKIAVGGDVANMPVNTARYIGTNLEVIQHPIPSRIGVQHGFIVMGTKDFRPMMQSLERSMEQLLQEAVKKKYDYILVPFFKTKSDNTGGSESTESPMHDKGSPKFIRNLKSQESCFYKRSLDVMSMGIVEAKLFLENFGTLNPPTPCPLISSTVRYERGPLRTDFDIETGVSSISVGINAQGGITTTIGYDSRKFIVIDKSIARDYLGSSRAIVGSTIVNSEPNYANAYSKNL